MARCLVTGGAGFIGSHLVDTLLARGHTVRVFDDFSTGKLENLRSSASSIELISGSVTVETDLEQVMGGVEYVFHLAALPSVQQSIENPLTSHEITATGTLKVLEVARKTGVRRVIYAASSSAYGNVPGEIRYEDDLLQPLSPYAAAKLAGEHYCQAFTDSYGLETVRLRFFNVFGPRQDAKSPYSGVIALFANAMREGRIPIIYGDGLQSRDFVYVANVVEALILATAAFAAVGQVYNIGMGSSITLLDLVSHLNDMLGTQLQPRHAPARPGDVRHSQADITRAKRDLGYAPAIPFAAGLQRTLASQPNTI